MEDSVRIQKSQGLEEQLGDELHLASAVEGAAGARGDAEGREAGAAVGRDAALQGGTCGDRSGGCRACGGAAGGG